MKKYIVLSITLLVFLTGCAKGTFKKSYKNMTIGSNGISGYDMNIDFISEDTNSYYIENYMNKNFKVQISSPGNSVIYYLIKNKKYKYVLPTGGILEEVKTVSTTDDIPYTNTANFLIGLERPIGLSRKKNVYTFTISDKDAKEIVKNTEFDGIKINDRVKVTVEIENKYITSINYIFNDRDSINISINNIGTKEDIVLN